ncbi:hypothetical protein EPH95_13750 [Salicibibacter halophilus]|uniref:Uncharacterized protein n=1 Tax=Salicibibacter halophilus TaxID=2502791 RepID=A0A514LJT0_9BACI|nr:hypothetical protein [Salicibibacter halophilus]QDI92118.1 hypothetical protein EPH95_13750 [Salicibibacter halophilus]
MSEYEEYIEERRKIDDLLQDDYWIEHVSEDLSGALVTFVDKKGKRERKKLRIGNADARKYFSVIVMKQQKKY